MEESEAYVEIAAKSWQEMKVKHLNIKCSKCGGAPDEIPPFGQKIKCKFCTPPTFYTIKEELNEASMKQIINGILKEYHTTFSQKEFDKLAAQIGNNYAFVVNEMKNAFQAQGKVSAECWQKLLDATSRIEGHIEVVERKVEDSHRDLKDTVQQTGKSLETKIDRLVEEVKKNPPPQNQEEIVDKIESRVKQAIENLPTAKDSRHEPQKKTTQLPPDYDDENY